MAALARSLDAPVAHSLVAGSNPLSRASRSVSVAKNVQVPARAVCRASGNSEKGSEEGSFQAGRREAMLSLGATATALALPPLSLVAAPGPASAADIIQRGQRAEFLTKLKIALSNAVEVNQDLIPSLLRLAINDALTYDKASKTGGANGSIRLPEELSRPENAGLDKAMKLLETVKAEVDEGQGEKGGPISYADLIVFGGSACLKRTFINSAIGRAGGDYKKGIELYRATGSQGQWGQFDKKFGRSDASEADPAGRLLVWDKASTTELKEKFAPYGLKPRQIVVLAIFLSDDFIAFEDKLAEDPEFQPWVAKYRRSRQTVSQTDYQVDLITVFEKFSVLGAAVNTEAYSYKELNPVRIRF